MWWVMLSRVDGGPPKVTFRRCSAQIFGKIEEALLARETFFDEEPGLDVEVAVVPSALLFGVDFDDDPLFAEDVRAAWDQAMDVRRCR